MIEGKLYINSDGMVVKCLHENFQLKSGGVFYCARVILITNEAKRNHIIQSYHNVGRWSPIGAIRWPYPLVGDMVNIKADEWKIFE